MANQAPKGYQKAYLELFEISGSGKGAESGGTKIEFQFNPKELQVVKKAKWEAKPSKNKNAPSTEYVGPEAASMSIEMFLDAHDDMDTEQRGRDVCQEVQKLIDACTPTQSSKSSKTPKPPGVVFGWGRVYFRGYIESVTAKYTRFLPSGEPIRAVCTIALKEFPKDASKQNPTSGALEAMGSHEVVAGDSLPVIAYREYRDPALWRAIAEANGIDDPMLLPPGIRLLVPAATEADRYR
jgi:nucleoid-associated protein YgaU